MSRKAKLPINTWTKFALGMEAHKFTFDLSPALWNSGPPLHCDLQRSLLRWPTLTFDYFAENTSAKTQFRQAYLDWNDSLIAQMVWHCTLKIALCSGVSKADVDSSPAIISIWITRTPRRFCWPSDILKVYLNDVYYVSLCSHARHGSIWYPGLISHSALKERGAFQIHLGSPLRF